MNWKIIAGILISFFVLMKFIVEFQRSDWTQVTATIIDQQEAVVPHTRRGVVTTRRPACLYSLSFSYQNGIREETKQVDGSCNESRRSHVVLLINPDNPDYYALDFTLDLG